MSATAFGSVFRVFRDRRELSLRDLGRLAEIDHAYIHRFETGEKEPPPIETLERLVRHLKLGAHELAVLRYLRERSIDPSLALAAIDDTTVTPEILDIASTAVFRGAGRPDPTELIRRAKRAKAIMDP